MAPKVSVCIPTYNYASYLAETIESVLCQSYTDFELLIIDDQSPDNTREVVAPFVARDPRVRFLVNPKNLGMVRNWNHCLEEARGDYIKYVFGDDLLASPDSLRRMVAFIEENDSVSLVCSARHFIDEHSRPLKVESHFEKTGIFAGTDVINSCLAERKNLIGEPSVVLFRKSQARRGFLDKYKQIVDLEMWFHLLEQGSFAYIEEPLCSFRIHDQQMTKKNRDSQADLTDYTFLIQDYLDKGYINLSGFMKAYLRYDDAYQAWRQHKKGRLDKATALELIDRHYGRVRFWSWYPLYKVFKPLLKMYRKVNR